MYSNFRFVIIKFETKKKYFLFNQFPQVNIDYTVQPVKSIQQQRPLNLLVDPFGDKNLNENKEIQKLKILNENLNKQIDELRLILEDREEKSQRTLEMVDGKEILKLEKTIQNLKTENQQIREEMREGLQREQELIRENKKLLVQQGESKKNIEIYREQEEQQKKQQVEKMQIQQRFSELQKEFQNLRAKQEEYLKRNQNLENEKQEMKKQKEDLEGEIRDISKAMESQKIFYQEQIEKIQKKEQNEMMAITALRNEIHQKDIQLQQMGKELEIVQKQAQFNTFDPDEDHRVQNLEHQLQQAKNKIVLLEKDHQQYRKIKSKNLEQLERIHELEKELTERQVKMQQVQREMELMKSTMMSQIEEEKTKVIQLEEQIKKGQSQLQETLYLNQTNDQEEKILELEKQISNKDLLLKRAREQVKELEGLLGKSRNQSKEIKETYEQEILQQKIKIKEYENREVILIREKTEIQRELNKSNLKQQQSNREVEKEKQDHQYIQVYRFLQGVEMNRLSAVLVDQDVLKNKKIKEIQNTLERKMESVLQLKKEKREIEDLKNGYKKSLDQLEEKFQEMKIQYQRLKDKARKNTVVLEKFKEKESQRRLRSKSEFPDLE